MATKKLDFDFVTSPPASAKRVIYWDSEFPGFGLDVKASGHKSYVFQYRTREGRTRRASFPGTLTLDAARKAARALQGDVARDLDPVEQKRAARRQDRQRGDTFKVLAKRYMRQDGKKLRSADERTRILEKYLYPKLGNRPIAEIRRSEISKVLDEIATKHGEVMSDHVLTVLRKVCNWYATKHDSYSPPFVKGMRKVSVRERARARILSDDELRRFWKKADEVATPYTRALQFVLVTATRRNEAFKMPRSEIAGDVWTIPKERFDRIPHESFPEGAREKAEYLRGLDPDIRWERKRILEDCGPFRARKVPEEAELLREATGRIEARRIAQEAETRRRAEKYGRWVEPPDRACQ